VIIVADIIDSDHLPIMFSILDPVRTREALDPVEKSADWELLKNLSSLFISPNIQIHPSNVADKRARDFPASTASAYRILTTKPTILDKNTKHLA
jgi:hypothetical protein